MIMNDDIDPFMEQKTPIDRPKQQTLFVNLDGFEGPIDLLLNLARNQKVDLTKIAILPVAEQYLMFVNNARGLDLEMAADYLVMAAWLAYLKSRLLLPNIEPEQAEEVLDMTDALRYQLLRLEAMQQAAKRLSSRPKLGQQRFTRGAPELFSTGDEPVWNATLYDLLACYGHIRSNEEAETLTIAATRLFSVEEASKRLRNLIVHSPEWTVLQHFLPEGVQSTMDVRSATASHIVASLELAREGVPKLRQDKHFAPLYMKVRDPQ